MNAAKKIILLLWLLIAASLGNASASTPGATENRVWQKCFETLETRQAEPLQTLGGHQENGGAGYDYAVDCLLAAEGGVPSALRSGQLAEGPALDAIGSGGKVTFTPTADQINSAAFKVIVGDAKYTASGTPVSTIFDGSTAGGLAEIKSGSSVLNSTYQLRLQTYGALVNDQPLTIFTSRAVNPTFSDWLTRWGVSVKPMP